RPLEGHAEAQVDRLLRAAGEYQAGGAGAVENPHPDPASHTGVDAIGILALHQDAAGVGQGDEAEITSADEVEAREEPPYFGASAHRGVAGEALARSTAQTPGAAQEGRLLEWVFPESSCSARPKREHRAERKWKIGRPH